MGNIAPRGTEQDRTLRLAELVGPDRLFDGTMGAGRLPRQHAATASPNGLRLRPCWLLGLVGVLALAVASPSTAQTAVAGAQPTPQMIVEMLGELKAAKADEAAQAKYVDELDAAAASKQKELQVYKDQVPELKKAYAALNAEADVQKADGDRQNAAVMAHRANCDGAKDNAVIAKCNGEVAFLNEWGRRVDERGESIARRVATLDTKRDSIVARANVLANDLGQIEKYKAQSMDRMQQARSRIADLNVRLKNICTNAQLIGTLEELKVRCGNRDFDGER